MPAPSGRRLRPMPAAAHQTRSICDRTRGVQSSRSERSRSKSAHVASAHAACVAHRRKAVMRWARTGSTTCGPTMQAARGRLLERAQAARACTGLTCAAGSHASARLGRAKMAPPRPSKGLLPYFRPGFLGRSCRISTEIALGASGGSMAVARDRWFKRRRSTASRLQPRSRAAKL